jgi:hypothetical protein
METFALGYSNPQLSEALDGTFGLVFFLAILLPRNVSVLYVLFKCSVLHMNSLGFRI